MSQHKTQITPKKDLKNKNCWGRRFGLNFPDEHSEGGSITEGGSSREISTLIFKFQKCKICQSFQLMTLLLTPY